MRLMERATRLVVAILASTGLTAIAAEHEAVPGEYLVKMRSPIAEDKMSMDLLSNQLGAHVKSTIPGMQIVVVQRPVFETMDSAKNSMLMNADVEYVEPNYIYRINRTPNDPMLGQLWGLNNTTNPGIDVNALKAWDVETGSGDVVVAVIDTGINYNHPDLRDNMWINTAEANGLPGVDDDGNGVVDDIYGFNAHNLSGDPMDDNGHGTHCAGTIGARGDDGQGIVGVAWNVKLMGIKFLTASGGGTLEGAVRGIDYANRMGAKILSNSWGGGGFSQALYDVILRSHENGSIFVAAAGNSRADNDARPAYPATYDIPNVISVAAIDEAGKLASFSSYGRTKVHVAAPGVNIVSSLRNAYGSMSGTSMATPHVSGVAALMVSNNPALTNVDVRERLVATSRPVAAMRNRVLANGIVDAYAALRNEAHPPDMNDPRNWANWMPLSISTAHPYENDFTETYEVHVPGANEMSLYFEKFTTEMRRDTLTIKTPDGKVIEVMSGENSDAFSAVIPGDRAVLEFKTDRSVTRYGFDLTKVMWR